MFSGKKLPCWHQAPSDSESELDISRVRLRTKSFQCIFCNLAKCRHSVNISPNKQTEGCKETITLVGEHLVPPQSPTEGTLGVSVLYPTLLRLWVLPYHALG